jgi:photosystem II stability/assembly factor-like uncharacterized protein
MSTSPAAAALAVLLLAGAAPAGGPAPAVAAPAAAAAPADLATADGWQAAPIWGADVRSLAIDPGDPDFVLAGTSGGQIYLSRDGGESWSDVAPRQPFLGWVVGSLRFDPNRPQRLWAGLWGLWGGGMVAFSDDLGVTWKPRAAGLPGQVYCLALVPGREGRLYAGTRAGVWGTSDGGGSWQALTADLPEVQKVTSLLVDPAAPDTVFAGTWRRAYRSDDGGRRWYGVFEGMVLDSEVFAIEPVPGRPDELWASTCGWVYRSADGGAHWSRFTEGLAARRTPSFKALADGRLLAGTVNGLYLSADGGTSWQRVTRGDLSVLAIGYAPERPQRVLVGTEGAGVWRSTDGGATFSPASRGMTNLRVAALVRSGSEVLAAVNHAGPASGLYGSLDGGRTFRRDLGGVPTTLELAATEGRVYAATERGLYERSAAAEWRRVGELGEGRVEGVAAAGGEVVARAGATVAASREGLFRPLPYHHGPLRSAVPWTGAVWATDGEGLYRLAGGENNTEAAPFPGGRLAVAAGGRLFLAGDGGAWSLSAPAAPWLPLEPRARRALATGDEAFPLLLVGDDAAWLFDAASGALLPLGLEVPARDVTSALVIGGRVLLGTAGYGVLAKSLAQPAPREPMP